MSDDKRFERMHSAPIFKKTQKDSHKIKLGDERFGGVLSDSRFRSTPGQVDRYGRSTKGANKKNAKDELEKLYEVDTEETRDNEKKASSKTRTVPSKARSTEDRMEYINKLARGEVSESGSSSDSSSDNSDSEDSSSNDDSDDDGMVSREKATKKKSVLDVPEEDSEEDIPTGDASSRLAVMHCDWDHMKSEDILVAMQSFCPAGGKVNTVTVYPSDFGLDQMTREEKYGPQGIWTKEGDAAADEVYEGIVGDLDDVSSNSDTDGTTAGKKDKKGDFRRNDGSVGLVLQDELVRLGKAGKESLLLGLEDDDEPVLEADGGTDSLAVRDYELRKLKYYFAVAELDSVKTSERLYEALDGVELEHSSMTFDLRFIPDDVDFSERKIRDTCTNAAMKFYSAPDFIVNALQHTNVKCTWDDGDTDRSRKLGGTLAQWKNLAESDMAQFLASGSESDGEGQINDDGEEEEDVVQPVKKPKKGKNKSKSKDIRKLLLGDAGDQSASEEDDFFVHPENDDDDDEGGNKVYSYIPEAASIGQTKDEELEDETPFEALKRKLAEKKKARKQAKKERSAATTKEITTKIPIGKEKQKTEASDEAELELMFGDDDQNGFDMRTVERNEKLMQKAASGKGKKNKKRNREIEEAKNTAPDDFKVDVQDNRFNKLLAGDSRFGIDPTSSEFKETQGMRDILSAQRKMRKTAPKATPSQKVNETVVKSSHGIDVAAIKRNFASKGKASRRG